MKRVFFIEMMGAPGSYDASVYDHFADKDQEAVWFVKRFTAVPQITIDACNVCIGDPLPSPYGIDGVVLAGTYNSVHDNTDWQQQVRNWLPDLRRHKIPILAICGSHQLLAHALGARVERLAAGPYAGTFPIALTAAGHASAIMKAIPDNAAFQFANSEHVLDVPVGGILLATSGRVPVAALDFGNHCYSTQFHPEGTDQTLAAVWRFRAPELMDNYYPETFGYRLVSNFLDIVANRDAPSVS